MAYTWLDRKKSKSFHCVVVSNSIRSGAQALMQSVGIGKLKPNTLIIGFKGDWQTCRPEDVQEYFGIIHDAFDLHYSIGILRLREGLQVSNPLLAAFGAVNQQKSFLHSISQTNNSLTPTVEKEDVASPLSNITDITDLAIPATDAAFSPPANSSTPLSEKLEEGQANSFDNPDSDDSNEDEAVEEEKEEEASGINGERLVNESQSYRKNSSCFSRKQKKGFIDVWWLFDDGGLTLLIPYLMTTKKLWKNCKLRVFMAGTKKDAFDRDQRRVALLLHKFRIQYASITVVTDICKRPEPESMKEFEDMIKDWVVSGEAENHNPWNITHQELTMQKNKTNRHVRLRELLCEHSSEATLIVMTLPMPKKSLCPAGLFMAWLDILTRDMPPILLLRGNQENVLTYYS